MQHVLCLKSTNIGQKALPHRLLEWLHLYRNMICLHDETHAYLTTSVDRVCDVTQCNVKSVI